MIEKEMHQATAGLLRAKAEDYKFRARAPHHPLWKEVLLAQAEVCRLKADQMDSSCRQKGIFN